MVKVEELKQHLPTYEDLQGSVNALLRLQDVYKLDVSDIAAGSVGGVSSSQLSGKRSQIKILDNPYYRLCEFELRPAYTMISCTSFLEEDAVSPIPSILYQTRRKYPLVKKGLNVRKLDKRYLLT